ncbi:MAG TPA: FAD-binding oxidoreductase [Thermoplasmata archaeon]|nr:FAD-binding oxidoreductase [Thermoplasmata archaeon]
MTGPARDRYATVIVGAGIIGLFTAYHLARSGHGPILVAERGFLSAGASGRNGGGVRQQWDTRETVGLAVESVADYRRFATEFGYNIWFRQGGYLFLAGSPAELDRLRAVQRTVAAAGLPARVVDTAQTGRLAPALDLSGIVGGTFLRSDGTLYPFPAIWALYETVRSLGVDVALGTEVTGVRTTDGRVSAVTTSHGDVHAPTVVNAAGGWSADLSRRAGLSVPNRPTRHEILATEPLKPFLDPMVVRSSDGLYFSQTMRGEIVGGLTVPHPEGTAPGMPSSAAFLVRMARALSTLVPRLARIGILRAWSGFYDDTPDGLPIVGEDPRLPGFVHVNGLGGHGFMLAPAVSRRVARVVLGEASGLDPALFGPGRFLGSSATRTSERLQLG